MLILMIQANEDTNEGLSNDLNCLFFEKNNPENLLFEKNLVKQKSVSSILNHQIIINLKLF